MENESSKAWTFSFSEEPPFFSCFFGGMAAASEGSAKSGRSKRTSAFLAGSCAGVFGSAMLQPLDVVKTRVQAGQAASAMQATKSLVQEHGAGSLWAGVGPACLRVAGGAGVFFLALDVSNAAEQRRKAEEGPRGRMMEALSTVMQGAGARALAGAVMCPVTVVKTRMEGSESMRKVGILAVVRDIAKQEGPLKLWSGLGATITRDAPYSGLYLLAYRHLQQALSTAWSLNEGSVASTAIAAALAGAAATAATQPADVVRARAQLGKKGLLHSVRDEGVSVLWLGCGPRVFRRACQQALTWSSYEQLVRFWSSVLPR